MLRSLRSAVVVPVVLLGAVLGAGCFLPISTAAPQPARTVGQGQWGATFSNELPTLNLIAQDTTTNPQGGSTPDDLVAPASAMELGLAYGLTDHVDLEVNAEGAMMVFIVPIPLGISGGVRAHIIHNDVFDLALAGRVGHIGLTTNVSVNGGESKEDHADATYFAGSVVIQLNPEGRVRPGLTLQEMPATVDVALSGEDPSTFKGAASSVTLSLELLANSVSITPFLAVTSFDSPDIKSARFVSGGIQLQRRNNVPRPRVLYVPAQPAPGPGVAPPPPPPSMAR